MQSIRVCRSTLPSFPFMSTPNSNTNAYYFCLEQKRHYTRAYGKFNEKTPYGLSMDELEAVRPLSLDIIMNSDCTVNGNEFWCMSDIRYTCRGYRNGDFTPSQLISEIIFRQQYLQPAYRFFISHCYKVCRTGG